MSEAVSFKSNRLLLKSKFQEEKWKELFIVYFYEDKENPYLITDEAFFLFDKTKTSIGVLCAEIRE